MSDHHTAGPPRHHAHKHITVPAKLGSQIGILGDGFVRKMSAGQQGTRIPGLRFGDARVHALLQALLTHRLLHHGFTNRDLCTLIAPLLGTTPEDITAGKMTSPNTPTSRPDTLEPAQEPTQTSQSTRS